MNGSQVRVRVIIPDDEVIHLISARKPADVTDAAMIAEDALALRVPFLGQAHTAGTALPLTGSHAEPPGFNSKGSAHAGTLAQQRSP